jgi:N4-gp56 family major capsid protein
MATTHFGVNDPETVKLWAKDLAREASKLTPIQPLIGDGPDSIIVKRTEMQRNSGDRVTHTLLMNLDGAGVTEGIVQEGNEESLATYTDNLSINELGHAVRIPGEGTIDRQRVPYNLREMSRDGMKLWFAERISATFFNHVCGYTPTNSLSHADLYRGNNAVVAATSTRILRPNSVANDESLSSTDTFDLTLVEYARELAETATPKIRPVMIGGQKKYVMYLHNYQATKLRTNTSDAQWLDIQRAALMGGKSSGNPLYTDALGEYSNVILRVANDVTQGVNSSTGAAVANTRRAVLLGAQSAVIAWGKGHDSTTSFKWVEALHDYDRELGVHARMIWGMKKTVYNSTDFATIVIPTYAAASS